MSNKIIIGLFILLSSANILIFTERQTLNLNTELKITILNIGQGDSVLIQTPDNQFGLIDTGKGTKIMQELGDALPLFTKTFEFIVLTHPDADHVEGFLSLIDKYKFKNIFIEKVPKESSIYLEIIEKLKNLDSKVYSITELNDFKIGDVTFDVLWPKTLELQDFASDINETSIAMLVKYKDFSFYSAGDLGEANELQSVNDLSDRSIDVLKVGHHGSKTSTSQEFLTETNSKVAVISVGKNNSYGHPNPETMDELEAANLNIYRTDIDGEIYIRSDGEKIAISTKGGKAQEFDAR